MVSEYENLKNNSRKFASIQLFCCTSLLSAMLMPGCPCPQRSKRTPAVSPYWRVMAPLVFLSTKCWMSTVFAQIDASLYVVTVLNIDDVSTTHVLVPILTYVNPLPHLHCLVPKNFANPSRSLLDLPLG
jgi:hypothetical protein